jgi:pimeloyl-ACP methyl ester carboxylesterase
VNVNVNVHGSQFTRGHLVIGEMRLEFQAHKVTSSADPKVAGSNNDRSTGMPTIVLLHEGLGCSAMWQDFPQRLSAASGADVFAYSRAGYGGSSACALPRPLDYMQREAQQTLPQVLDAIDAPAVVLLGHSDGASIAAVYAGAHADPRVQGVVMVAPHFFVEAPGLLAIAQAKIAFEQHGLRDKLRKYHGDNVDCAFRGWNEAWLHPDFRRWDITHYLPNIKAPILTIQGEHDQYGSAAQLRAVSEHCATSVETLVLPDCAHSPFKEQMQHTLDTVCRWITALPANSRSLRLAPD